MKKEIAYNENIICRLRCFDEGWERSKYMDKPDPGDTIILGSKEYLVKSVTSDDTISGPGQYDFNVSIPINCYNITLTPADDKE